MSGRTPFAKTVVVFLAATFLITLYFFADARTSSIFPRCIFYAATGFYCPGCGSQRALSSLLHGEIAQALNYNFLFMLCLPLLGYSAVVHILNLFRSKPLVQRIFYSNVFVKALFGIVIIFWIARNFHFYPFKLLAPH